ncbi:hypothetical protein WIW50_01665 [Flavobacteriaceae bacterium 3-367]|uniref:hypothetical protein n=1 Tax=Eudoraea algarum TaxID=3417568 RepID=UPI0032883102
MKQLNLAVLLLFSLGLMAQEPKLDLHNGDVLKCLVQSAENAGWKLIKNYYNSKGKLVLVFTKAGKTKEYVSK